MMKGTNTKPIPAVELPETKMAFTEIAAASAPDIPATSANRDSGFGVRAERLAHIRLSWLRENSPALLPAQTRAQSTIPLHAQRTWSAK